jgi:DNA-binding Xre family transcriptional regulator
VKEKRTASEYSKAAASVILGLYKAKRWNQKMLSEKTGITVSTLQRMVAGYSEISARELSVIAGVLGTTPQEILRITLEQYGGLDRLIEDVSPAPSNVAPIRKRPDTAQEIDDYAGAKAANEFSSEGTKENRD